MLRRLLLASLLACCGLVVAAATSSPRPVDRIVVNKWNNTLKVYRDGQLVWHLRVATGTDRSTPVGQFKVIQRWPVDRLGRGPYGTHWLGLNTLGRQQRGRIGIHGTNEPASIGKYASHGCVRCRNADIARLYALTPLGTAVWIIDQAVRPEPVGPARPASGRAGRRPGLATVEEPTVTSSSPPVVLAPSLEERQ
ncbi:MAG: L,D-transpeptidase [Fimbriimonadaceae bacterium]|nr:L,D-transpeptidase [Fimbriimonadaceae bacterium]